jgi:hypothetical protein
MRMDLKTTGASLVIYFAAGCSDTTSRPDPAAELSLIQLDPVMLVENDSMYLGRPAGFVVDDADGALYVVDAFWGRALRFSPSGEVVRVYGERGEGSGELKDPGAIAVDHDDVMVADVGSNRLARFDKQTGEFKDFTRYEGVLTSIQPIRPQDERVWFGVQDRVRNTSVGLLTPGAPGLRYLGELPGEFKESESLAGIYSGIQVIEWSDTLLVGFMGLNRLLLMRSDGMVLDTVRVPVRERRGEMDDIVKGMAKMEFPQMFSANSALFKLHRLPSGSVALVHYDQKISGDLINARVFVGLMSRDFTQACVDREISVFADGQPLTAFRGDTLFVLQQHVEGEETSASVDRYVIDESSCFGGS